jgi:integrase
MDQTHSGLKVRKGLDALESGADLFAVSPALGHADIGTTANVYGYFTEAMANEMADRMTGILDAAENRRTVREIRPTYAGERPLKAVRDA